MRGERARPRSIQEYVESVPSPLSQDKFAGRLSEFLATQLSAPSLTPLMIGTLFKITDDYLRIQPALESMKRDRFAKDLKGQKAVFKGLSTYARKWKCLVRGGRYSGLSGARALERALKIRLQREIEAIEFQRRRIDAIEDQLVNLSSKPTQERGLMRELDIYLERACALRPTDRDLVIGGVLKAAELSPDVEEPVSIVPMRRSTAKKELQSVELCVDWIDQLPGYRTRKKINKP